MASTSIDRHHFLLGTIPTDDDKTITGARLPTSQQVLLYFIAHHSATVTVREAANITIDTVLLFYQGAIHKGRPQLGGEGGSAKSGHVRTGGGGGGGGGLGQNEDVLKKSQFSTILW